MPKNDMAGGMQNDVGEISDAAKSAAKAIKDTKKAVKNVQKDSKSVAAMAAQAAAGNWAGAFQEAVKNPRILIAIIALCMLPALLFLFVFVIALPATIIFVVQEVGKALSSLWDTVTTWGLEIVQGFGDLVRDIFTSPQERARRAEIIAELEAQEQAVAYDPNFGEYVDVSTGLITMINDDFKEGYALCLQDAEHTANRYIVKDSNVVKDDEIIFDDSTLDKTSGDYASYVWLPDQVSVNISQNEGIDGVKVYLKPVCYLLAIQSQAEVMNKEYEMYGESDGATAEEKNTSTYHLLKTSDKFAKDQEDGVFEGKVQHRVNYPSAPVVTEVTKLVDDTSKPIYEWVPCSWDEGYMHRGESDYRQSGGGYEHYERTGYEQMEVFDHYEAYYVVSVDVTYWVMVKPDVKEVLRKEYDIPHEKMDLVDAQYETLIGLYTSLSDAGELLPGGFDCSVNPLPSDEIEAIVAACNVSGYRERVIRYALQQVGHFGYYCPGNASGASSGYLDCSGFMQYSYWGGGCADFSSVTTYGYQTATDLTAIARSEMQPGDLSVICRNEEKGALGLTSNHVRMYLGDIKGDGTIYYVECTGGIGTNLNNWSDLDNGGLPYRCAYKYVGAYQ